MNATLTRTAGSMDKEMRLKTSQFELPAGLFCLALDVGFRSGFALIAEAIQQAVFYNLM